MVHNDEEDWAEVPTPPNLAEYAAWTCACLIILFYFFAVFRWL